MSTLLIRPIPGREGLDLTRGLGGIVCEGESGISLGDSMPLVIRLEINKWKCVEKQQITAHKERFPGKPIFLPELADAG